MSQTSPAYQNITISGVPGSGSTTLLKLLKTNLPDWQGFSGGDFMRAYALEKGLFKENKGLHHSAADYEDEFDRKIDFGMREKLEKEKNWILEAWLSGFLAQGIPGTLKVLLFCSDDAVRVDRIVNRDQWTVKTALENIRRRTHNNMNKWTRMYKDEWESWVVGSGKAKPGEPIDFWKQSLYAVCIDTYKTNAVQAF